MENEKLFMNGFGIEMKPSEFNCVAEETPNCFFNPNWENSMDQSDPFESALSSIVSSPVTVTSNSNEPAMIRELIGRLGNICNSREISPLNSSHTNNNNSANVSCYSTPLNSPPKLNVSVPFGADPGFVERAARFSCFSSLNGQFGLNESELLSGLTMPKAKETGDCREESAVSEQMPVVELSKNVRKRKAIPRGKAKETQYSASNTKVAAAKDESNAKRSKSEEENEKKKEEENVDQKQNKENSKPTEQPKDYIHVRARRGQATDNHSLAERVRREKISQRMKFLQDLVPGCNKVTGKAVMLDEIINYVQSLQRQVEFLSMKLATVNPRTDMNMEVLVSNSKDIFEGRGTLGHSSYQLETLPHSYQSQQSIPTNPQTHFSNNTLNAFLPSFDGFALSSAPPQVSALWEDDLQSVVQMGFGQNQQQGFHGAGSVHGAQTKVEI